MQNNIRIKIVGIFRRSKEVLLVIGEDKIKKKRFYYPPGGGVEFGESSSDALRREIREELNVQIKNEKLLGVLENRFEYNGEKQHEIVFVFGADFSDKALYNQSSIEIQESNNKFNAEWVDLNNAKYPIFPEGIINLVQHKR